MLILLTNDDGINALGLTELRRAVSEIGRTIVVAPHSEMSATSHSLSLHRPLTVRHLDAHTISVEGTPTDCVLIALQELLDETPCLLISGINHGPNLGHDVNYSGTVAAAIEGSLWGVPSISISLAVRQGTHFDVAGEIAAQLVQDALDRGIPEGTVLNVNVPDKPRSQLAGIKITRLSRRIYGDAVRRCDERNGAKCVRIGKDSPILDISDGTDVMAVENSFVSITPLCTDTTNYRLIGELKEWEQSLGNTLMK